MTARQVRALVVDIVTTAALPVAIFAVSVSLAWEVGGWLAVLVATTGAEVALGAGFARARWHCRGGAS